MEEIEVVAGCDGAGQTIGDVSGAALIVALRSSEGRVDPQPSLEAKLKAGDVLVAAGTPAAMERLEALFAPAGDGAAAKRA
jgi:K+/H+ antiporter YhaU regulatory subunit KhtT